MTCELDAISIIFYFSWTILLSYYGCVFLNIYDRDVRSRIKNLNDEELTDSPQDVPEEYNNDDIRNYIKSELDIDIIAESNKNKVSDYVTQFENVVSYEDAVKFQQQDINEQDAIKRAMQLLEEDKCKTEATPYDELPNNVEDEMQRLIKDNNIDQILNLIRDPRSSANYNVTSLLKRRGIYDKLQK
jgi:hypothetical protein